MTAQSARRTVFALVFLALALGAARDFLSLGDALPWRNMDDFADFYCAGWALDRGASPYTYEPLRTCEHDANKGPSFRQRVFAANPALAFPAPQPPYDFLPFAALARMPFSTARTLGACAIVLAVVLSALLLSALGPPLALAAAVFALSTAYVALNTGQIVPFALLALLGCGVALARSRCRLAGICAALTAIEPALGIPVVLATLCYVPRARVTLVAACAALLILGWAAIGLHGVIAYLTVVLPAHAQSELRFPFQYSLTYALAALGAPPPVARIGGTLSYLLLLGAGLAIAPKAAERLQRRELIVFIPALCSVVAGPFLHQEELCFAIPAVTILAWRSTATARTICAASLCVLAVPWIVVWGEKRLLLASLLVCATILTLLRIEIRRALATFVAVGAALYAFELAPPHLPAPSHMPAIYAPAEIVQDEWRAYTQLRSTADPAWYAIKIPTWVALLAALLVAGGGLRRRDQLTDAEAAPAPSTSRRI